MIPVLCLSKKYAPTARFLLIQKLKLLNISPSFFIKSLGTISALFWLYILPSLSTLINLINNKILAKFSIGYIDDYLQLPLADGIAPKLEAYVEMFATLLGPAMLLMVYLKIPFTIWPTKYTIFKFIMIKF